MWLCPLQPPQGECPLPFEPHRRDDPSRTLGQRLPAPVTPGQRVTLSLHSPAKGTALRPPFPLHPFPAVSVHLPPKYIYEPLHSLSLREMRRSACSLLNPHREEKGGRQGACAVQHQARRPYQAQQGVHKGSPGDRPQRSHREKA